MSGVNRYVFIVVSLCAYDCEYVASVASGNFLGGLTAPPRKFSFLVVSGST